MLNTNNLSQIMNEMDGLLNESELSQTQNAYSNHTIYTKQYRYEDKSSKKKLQPKISRTIREAKGELGGFSYESEVTQYVKDTKVFYDKLRNLTDGLDEKYENIQSICQMYLDKAISEGRVTQEEITLETDFKIGRTQYKENVAIKNAFARCIGYWDTLTDIRQQEKIPMQIITSELQKHVKLDLSIKSKNEILTLANKRYSRSNEYIKQIDDLRNKTSYYTEAMKSIISQIQLGKDSDQSILFASMYVSIMQDNAHFIDSTSGKWSTKTNSDTGLPFTSKQDYIENTKYKRVSSLFDIFSDGALAMFYRIENDDFDTVIDKVLPKALIKVSVGSFTKDQVVASLENSIKNKGGMISASTIDGKVMMESVLPLLAETTSSSCTDDIRSIKKEIPAKAFEPMANKEELTAFYAGKKEFRENGVFTSAYDKYEAKIVGYIAFDNMVKIWVSDVTATFEEAKVISEKNRILEIMAKRKEQEAIYALENPFMDEDNYLSSFSPAFMDNFNDNYVNSYETDDSEQADVPAFDYQEQAEGSDLYSYVMDGYDFSSEY